MRKLTWVCSVLIFLVGIELLGGNIAGSTVTDLAALPQIADFKQFQTPTTACPTDLIISEYIEDSNSDLAGNWNAEKHTLTWTVASLAVRTPQLSLHKTVTPLAGLYPGDVVIYTLAFTNTGNTLATGGILTDSLPWEMTFGGWVEQPVGAEATTHTVTWNGLVDVAQTITLVFTSVVRSDSFFVTHDVINTATFTAENVPIYRAYAAFALEGGTTVNIRKEVTPTTEVMPGDLVTYTITLDNPSQGLAGGVQLTDTLPWELNFAGWVTQPAGATVVDNVITWQGDLAAGAQLTIAFQAKVRVDSFLIAHDVINVAVFTADNVVGAQDNAIFSLGGVVLEIDKAVTPLIGITPGSVVTYTIVLSNTSRGVISGIEMTDIFPEDVDFEDWVTMPVIGMTMQNWDAITWLGDLDKSTTITFVFTVRVNDTVKTDGHAIPNTTLATATNAIEVQDTATFIMLEAYHLFLPVVTRE